MLAASPWNSLEIVKIVVAGTTPVAVAVLAAVLSRALKRAENRQWFSQKLVEKRIELLATALPDLNDLLCYFTWVGNWKELSPTEVLVRKRRLDRLFYANSPFFSASALDAYEGFTSVVFRTFVAPGSSAQLRTALTSRHGSRAQVLADQWDPAWASMFAGEAEQTSPEVVKKRYEVLTAALGADVGAQPIAEDAP